MNILEPQNVKTLYLIEQQKEFLWNHYDNFENIFAELGAPFPPEEHLQHIKSKGGEKIILFSEEDSEILGWIGIIPDGETRKAELAGIEVHSQYRNKGYGTKLIEEAQKWLTNRGMTQFTFQTSPLFTANSLLYFNRFQTKYRWNNQHTLPPDNIPWPVVDCEMKWDPSPRKIDLKDKGTVLDQSILKWKGLRPVFEETILDSEKQYQSLEIPFLSLPIVFGEFRKGNFEVARISFKAFEWLSANGYDFFDFKKYKEKYYYLFKKLL